jgi:hypothetical protein
VIADYDARTAVERELMLRLASLLWRLRRLISIETGLLQIQSDIARKRRAAIGMIQAPPISYSVNGKRYVAILVGARMCRSSSRMRPS